MSEQERHMNEKEQPRYKLGDIVKMKKPHPCGTNAWEIVRTGKAGKLPNDKLIQVSAPQTESPAPTSDGNDFMSIPDGTDDELPF